MKVRLGKSLGNRFGSYYLIVFANSSLVVCPGVWEGFWLGLVCWVDTWDNSRSCGLRSLPWEKLLSMDLFPAFIHDREKLDDGGEADGGRSLFLDIKAFWNRCLEEYCSARPKLNPNPSWGPPTNFTPLSPTHFYHLPSRIVWSTQPPAKSKIANIAWKVIYIGFFIRILLHWLIFVIRILGSFVLNKLWLRLCQAQVKFKAVFH